MCVLMEVANVIEITANLKVLFNRNIRFWEFIVQPKVDFGCRARHQVDWTKLILLLLEKGRRQKFILEVKIRPEVWNLFSSHASSIFFAQDIAFILYPGRYLGGVVDR